MNNFLNYFNKVEYEKLKNIDDMYLKAQAIIKRVYRKILDKGGHPYLNHLYYVSECSDNVEEKIIGLLHDIIEDTEITENDLYNIHFSDEIVESISIITRNKKAESYNEYIDRLINSNNISVLNIKKFDLENNMDLSRIENPTEIDYNRKNKKYMPQYKRIVKVLEKRND